MKCKLNDFLNWLSNTTPDRVRRMHNFLWGQFHSISLKSHEGISLMREILWKIRHVQLRLKEMR